MTTTRPTGYLIVFTLALLGGFRTGHAEPWEDGMSTGGSLPQIELDAKTASPTKLAIAGVSIPLGENAGGFVISDYNAKKNAELTDGKISQEGETINYSSHGDDLVVSAAFTPMDGYIQVTGEIENKRGDDRPVIVHYILPLPTSGAVFEDEVSHSERVTDQTKGLGTVFPLAAMTGKDWGAALAIPPTAPCCFGMTGTSEGLGVEFYFGLTAKTKNFPNKAPFSFVIYPAVPGWGFRSALAHYYKNYADYYNNSTGIGGFNLWAEKGAIDYALPLFRIQGIAGHAPDADGFQQTVERAKKGNLLTTEYIGATARSAVGLAELPTDYAGAMKAYADYKVKWNALTEQQQEQEHHPYYFRDLTNVIEHSVITNADGKDILQLRDFSWSPKSITFTSNPNPALFADKGWNTVGSETIAHAQEYLKTDPVDGTLVDSLGANFPAHLNYRQEHFPYEQYPLTFDRQGRVAIHNMISHYELMAALRQLTHQMQKISTANGIYRYTRRPQDEENYNGLDNGRFFIASLLDHGMRECSKLLTRSDLEFGRAAMGRKLYTTAIHSWSDGNEVRAQLNRSLPFTDFSLPEGGKPYLTDKDGYFRDQDALEWFIKNARILCNAGWQPMTYATVDQPTDVACERYGSGGEIYLALVNFSDQPRQTRVSINLNALGLKGPTPQVTEIAQNAAVTSSVEGDMCQVQIKLDPSKACILKLLPGKS